MKALTIWQPYASLIIGGKKKFETRPWRTRYRGPLVIHAGQKSTRIVLKTLSDEATDVAIEFLGADRLQDLPTGRVLGIVRLVDCIPIDEAFVAALSPEERAIGDYTIGRYAWKLSPYIVPFQDQVQAAGSQGLWDFTSPEVEKYIKENRKK